ncbi:cyclin-like protein, partial [Martensiomyces pterosporus]
EQWLFTKEDIRNTPSLVGSDYATPAGKSYTLAEERGWRLRGCNFIHNVVRKLELSQAVAATACVFFHRFYMRQSLSEYHAYEVAGACVFLSTKVEEEKRSLKSITQVCSVVGAKGNEKEAAKNRESWHRHLQRLEIIAALAHVNDCLRTVICLLYRPEVIAVAALYLASN